MGSLEQGVGLYYIVEEMLLHPQGSEGYASVAFISKMLEIEPPSPKNIIDRKGILGNPPNISVVPHLGQNAWVWLLLLWERAMYMGKLDDLCSQLLSTGQEKW